MPVTVPETPLSHVLHNRASRQLSRRCCNIFDVKAYARIIPCCDGNVTDLEVLALRHPFKPVTYHDAHVVSTFEVNDKTIFIIFGLHDIAIIAEVLQESSKNKLADPRNIRPRFNFHIEKRFLEVLTRGETQVRFKVRLF